MADEYAALAPVYTRSGLADFSVRVTGRLHDYAQAHEWMGRRILDLGCGSGAVLDWFVKNRPRLQLLGVDNEPAMLATARAQMGSAVDLYEQDLRSLSGIAEVDMAIAMNVINEIDNLRELGTVFENVQKTLNPGKLFIFDLHTNEGLAKQGEIGDQRIIDESDLTIFCRNDYDYEQQMYSCDYTIYHQVEGAWTRGTASRKLRAYPVQAVAVLLRRSGFEVSTILSEGFNRLNTPTPGTLRVFFIAIKQ